MLSLSKLLLHNWHRFEHHVIEIEGGLYLAGENGAGKSSVLDALQLVLIADQRQIRFNGSAQERVSARNLDSYVRGKIGEDRYLRPGNTVACVALEFTPQDGGKVTPFTAGACLEASDGHGVKTTFFILSAPLEPDFYAPNGHALTRSELKKRLTERRGEFFDSVSEYQVQLLNRLGGLNKRFLSLFMQALAFKPIRNVREFVEQWILPEKPLELSELQRTKEELDKLGGLYNQTVEQIAALEVIVAQQTLIQRQRVLHQEYVLAQALLEAHAASLELAQLQRRVGDADQQLGQAQLDMAQAAALRVAADGAYADARVRLQTHDLAQRERQLQGEVRDLEQQLEVMTKRRDQLARDWAALRDTLEPLLREGSFDAEERAELSALLDSPLAASLDDTLATLLMLLKPWLEQVGRARVEAQQQREQLTERSDGLKQRIKALEAGQAQYPQAVERLRDLLAAQMPRPQLLCEALEVLDEAWQNAVEAMLGARRFNLLVAPQHYRLASQQLELARSKYGIAEIAVIDLERAAAQGRPARAGSLARFVQADDLAVQAYTDSVLGNIMACESVDAARHFERAVTREVMLYSEWSLRAVSQVKYREWYIGRRAKASQLELAKQELIEVLLTLGRVQPRLSALDRLKAALEREAQITALRKDLQLGLDATALQTQLDLKLTELNALDLDSLEALKQQVTQLKKRFDDESQREKDALVRSTNAQSSRDALQGQRLSAVQTEEIKRLHAQTQSAHFPAALMPAQALLEERVGASDLELEVQRLAQKSKEFQTRGDNERGRFYKSANDFNRVHQLSANALDADTREYQLELERLRGSALSDYQAQIASSRTAAERELREHVLSKLSEQFEESARALSQINAALESVDFRGERYRFRSDPASGEFGEFYNLIRQWGVRGVQVPGALFESSFFDEHRAVFERFYERFSASANDEKGRLEQEGLKDYRRYQDYEIIVTHSDKTTDRFSKIMGQTSGGETQTPFYLTIAASFVQEYRINQTRSGNSNSNSSRPTIRLVVFDEAFSKMDQDRIGAALELFQRFGLQLVIATPLDRCVYIVPKMQTNLVLSRLGSHSVHVEHYRNYAAQLVARTPPV